MPALATIDPELDFIATLPKQLFIDGEWIDASDGATSAVEDPSADASPSDGGRALADAARVQDSWALAQPPGVDVSEVMIRATGQEF